MTIIRSYGDCHALAQTRKRVIDNNTRLITDDGPAKYHIKLHNTNIITYCENGDVVLNSGGWRTSTTKARMNEYSPVSIWQASGLWTARWRGESYPYADGITFNTWTGKVTGQGEDPKAEVKLRRRVLVYAENFVEALARGEVPQPSAGDCWGCCMKEVGTGKEVFGNDHLLSHVEEKYYVPSLLVNAINEGNTSSVAKWYAQAAMDNEPPVAYWENIALAQLKKVIFDYMAHRLGLTPGRTTYRR